MKNTVRLDHENRQIVMDRTFAKLSANIRNIEYQMLQDVRRDYPDYQVVTRRIKKNHAKECYKGLTYAYMRDYITRHSGTRSKEYQTFSEMIDISKCHSDAYRYPVIKKWFLDTYEEIKTYGIVDEIPEERMFNAA